MNKPDSACLFPLLSGQVNPLLLKPRRCQIDAGLVKVEFALRNQVVLKGESEPCKCVQSGIKEWTRHTTLS